MAKIYKLTRGTTEQVKEDEWLLIPLTPSAFDAATQKLDQNWTDSLHGAGSKPDSFVFRHSLADSSVVLKSLSDCGISLEEVDISGGKGKSPTPAARS